VTSYRVTQIRSKIGTQARHRGTLRALGLGKIGSSRVHQESPQLVGMLRRVAYLVKVEPAEAGGKGGEEADG
jgi:large subunit ribosomal protein L30